MTDKQPEEIYVVSKPEDFGDAFMKLVEQVRKEIEEEDKEKAAVSTPPTKK